MTDFFRFPHTPHLAWLGEGEPRDDKVIAYDEAQVLLAESVAVEEKVDGANLGFSTGAEGELRVQNRGNYLDLEHAHPQFRPLGAWLAARETALVDALWPDLVLFGEWCFAVHSVVYDRLPDWFLGFDVYDRAVGRFWDRARRDELVDELGLFSVPFLASGHVSLDGLRELLAGTSLVGTGVPEGVVVRTEGSGFTQLRAKLVRPEFSQAIGEHWSRVPLRKNRLAQGAAPC